MELSKAHRSKMGSYCELQYNANASVRNIQ